MMRLERPATSHGRMVYPLVLVALLTLQCVYYRPSCVLTVLPAVGTSIRVDLGGCYLKRLVVGVVVAGVLTAASSIPTSPVRAGNSASTHQVSPTRAPSPSDIVQTAKQYLGS